jgi:hypothetical protein
MNSRFIKGCLLHYFRFERQFVAATEVSYGVGIADVMAYNDTSVIEVEVKISKNDLLHEKDSKANKHYWIKENIKKSKYDVNYPNKFYFCIPEFLINDCEKLIEELNPNYGIMVCKSINNVIGLGKIDVYKKAKTVKYDNEKLKYFINKRLSSEICNLYSLLYNKETKIGV